jgi:hypothetical protein
MTVSEGVASVFLLSPDVVVEVLDVSDTEAGVEFDAEFDAELLFPHPARAADIMTAVSDNAASFLNFIIVPPFFL